MKRKIFMYIAAFSILATLLTIKSTPNYSMDEFYIQDTDGTVYRFLTAGGNTCMPDPAYPLEISIKASNAHNKINRAGIWIEAGGYYIVPGGSSSPKSATPSAPKSETKNKEAKCEHEYTSEVTTNPTCKDKGLKTFTCSKCGDTYTEEIDVTGEHNLVEEMVKEATCTEDGEIKKVCSICGYEETSSIPKLEHIYKEEITKEAACTENGVKTIICELCGDTYTEEIKATGHVEGEFEVTKPNGMFTDGEQIKKCTVCGEILKTEVIPSKYPIWYLYCGIGLLIVIIGIIVGIVVKKKKN